MRRFPFPLAALLTLGSLSCGGSKDNATPTPTAPTPTVLTTIRVTLVDSVLVVGKTTQATAATLDQFGAAMPGKIVTWRSTDSTIASVQQTGIVLALKEGAVSIQATADTKQGSANLRALFVPVVTSVRVALADTVPSLGGITYATATVLDQNGAPIRDVTIQWSSSNAGVADVSANGAIVAKARGTFTVAASAGAVTGSATARVRAIYKTSLHEISLPIPGLTAGQVRESFGMVPSAVVYTAQGESEHLLINPSLYYKEPTIPIHHFVKDAGRWRLQARFTDVAMGVLRDHVRLENSSFLAFADHGLELATGYDTWVFGDVWTANILGTSIRWNKISNTKAFNHSITASDLNSDGRQDLIVLNMGQRPNNNLCNSLHVYTQASDQSFSFDPSVIECLPPQTGNLYFGYGAVLAVDINKDGVPEIIQADYVGLNSAFFPYAFVVYGRASLANGKARYTMKRVIARAGGFSALSRGATKMIAADLNSDNNLDLVVTLEDWTGGATVEIWYGDGAGDFRFSWQSLIEQPSSVAMRELEVVDVNQDKRPDLLLNAYAPTGTNGWWNQSTQTADLSKLIWLNTSNGFKRPAPLPISVPTNFSPFVRWFSVGGKIKGFFIAMGNDQVLKICEVELLEDFGEILRTAN